MINYKEIFELKKVPVTITCDICNKIMEITPDTFQEYQEFVEIETLCGPASIFGDNSYFKLHICQYCLNEKFGDIINKIKIDVELNMNLL